MDVQRFERAVALQGSGRVEESLRELRAMEECTPDREERASLLLNEVTCLLRLGRSKEARRLLVEARDLVPPGSHTNVDVDFAEVGFLIANQKPNDAVRKLDGLLKQYPDVLGVPEKRYLYEAIQVRRGILMAEAGRFSEASPILKEALSFDLADGDKGDLCYSLGVCELKLGDRESAKRMFLEALDRGTRDYHPGRAHYYLGIIYFDEGAYARAEQEFQSCAPHAKHARIPLQHIHGWLAATFRGLGQDDEADRYDKLAKQV